MLPGLILTKSLSAPRSPEIAGAYLDKISFYVPLSRYRRGLSWKNLFLRPAVRTSPGLILTKSLSTPRCPEIAGAYLDEISICAPLLQDRWGLFWHNLLLSPAVQKSKGISTWFCLLYPRSRRPAGIINLVLPHIPSSTKTSGYNRLGFASHTLVRESQRVYRLDFVSHTLVHEDQRV